MTSFTESTVASAALAWLEAIGWRVVHGDTFHWGGERLRYDKRWKYGVPLADNLSIEKVERK